MRNLEPYQTTDEKGNIFQWNCHVHTKKSDLAVPVYCVYMHGNAPFPTASVGNKRTQAISIRDMKCVFYTTKRVMRGLETTRWHCQTHLHIQYWPEILFNKKTQKRFAKQLPSDVIITSFHCVAFGNLSSFYRESKWPRTSTARVPVHCRRTAVKIARWQKCFRYFLFTYINTSLIQGKCYQSH